MPHRDFLGPSELHLLSRLLVTICDEIGCEPDSLDAEMTALRLITLYQAGLQDEAQLMAHCYPERLLQRAA